MQSSTGSAVPESACAVYLKALGDPIRLQLVRALTGGPLSVSDLAILLEMQISNVSHHLRVLHHAGIVDTEREGKFIYYRLKLALTKKKKSNSQLDFGCCKLELG